MPKKTENPNPTPGQQTQHRRLPTNYIVCTQQPYRPPEVSFYSHHPTAAIKGRTYLPSQASISRLQHVVRYRVFDKTWTLNPAHGQHVGWVAIALTKEEPTS